MYSSYQNKTGDWIAKTFLNGVRIELMRVAPLAPGASIISTRPFIQNVVIP